MIDRRKRFLPGVATIKENLASGRLGALGLLRIHRWTPRRDSTSPAQETTLGSVVEEVDLARWLFDSAPATIHAAGRDLGEGYYLQVHFGFPGGGMALIDRAPLPARSRPYFSISAIGASGAAYADDHHNTHLVFGDGEPTALISDQESEALRGQLETFLEAIAAGNAATVAGNGERQLIEITTAIRRSLSDGCPMARQGDRYEPSA